MKIIISKNKNEASHKVSNIILTQIKKKPNSVLGLASGKTMIPIYGAIVKASKKEKIDWASITTFNLDEYSNSNEFHSFMNKHLFSKINIKKANINFPRNSGYDKKISSLGGIDLMILGIGRNDHIAFNEPRSSFSSKTRVVSLTKETQAVNRTKHKKAITMGISTILNSKRIILIAFGNEKAQAIYKALKGPVSESVPATSLRKHKNTTFILDRKAGRLLR